MKNYQSLDISIESHIAVIMLNRPEVHNSVNETMMSELEAILDYIENDQKIRCIVLTGSGEKTFCAGGDLKYFATLRTETQVQKMSLRMQAIMDRFYRGDRPVIAAVNGQALGGGCEILSACHIRIAAKHATFGFRQVPNGIITGWGGGERFLQQVGSSRALPLMLSGNRFDVKTALSMGWLYNSVDSRKALYDAIEFAKNIAAYHPPAVSAILSLARSVESGAGTLSAKETAFFIKCWRDQPFQAILQQFTG